MHFHHAIKFTQIAIGLVPKMLDSIDTIFSIRKSFVMTDPVLLEITNIKNITTTPYIKIDDAIGQNFTSHYGNQCLARDTGDDLCVNLSTMLK